MEARITVLIQHALEESLIEVMIAMLQLEWTGEREEVGRDTEEAEVGSEQVQRQATCSEKRA